MQSLIKLCFCIVLRTWLEPVRCDESVRRSRLGAVQKMSAFHVDTGLSQAATFVTPGHEFFSAMPHRGATATDIVLVIVALDAGVQLTIPSRHRALL